MVVLFSRCFYLVAALLAIHLFFALQVNSLFMQR